MNDLLRRAAMAFCCILLLSACDAASATPLPLVVSPEATLESPLTVAAGEPAPSTSTPAPPITAINKTPDGKYLFLEIWYDAVGSGNLPRQIIEFPTYAFDSAKGSLSPTQFSRGRLSALHQGDWGLLGTGSRRSGSAGSGSGSGLERLTALPFSTNVTLATGQASDSGETTRKAIVKLVGASSDGKVEAEIDGERVVLAPGARWQRKALVELTTVSHNGRYDLTSTVTNYGWLEQAKIQSVP
jgi:hypothetical protein